MKMLTMYLRSQLYLKYDSSLSICMCVRVCMCACTPVCTFLMQIKFMHKHIWGKSRY
jgi:hypothetical protein